MEETKIVYIDDNLPENDPIIVLLREKYGDSNVILKRKSSEGLKVVLDLLPSRIIVLLDLDLGPGQPSGAKVFEEIRNETSLVYVIFVTAKQFDAIPPEDLIHFINNDALAIVNNTEDLEVILNLVEKAYHKLDTRIDCILEQWIAKRPQTEQDQPYLMTKGGKTYTLKDVMIEIRKETDLGKRLKKGILQLAIEMLTNESEKIDD